jgi:hypothetical protein
VNQRQDLTQAIQTMRHRAVNVGTLKSTAGNCFDNALRGRTLSAAAALQTAAVAAYVRPTGPRTGTCRSKPKA